MRNIVYSIRDDIQVTDSAESFAGWIVGNPIMIGSTVSVSTNKWINEFETVSKIDKFKTIGEFSKGSIDGRAIDWATVAVVINSAEDLNNSVELVAALVSEIEKKPGRSIQYCGSGRLSIRVFDPSLTERIGEPFRTPSPKERYFPLVPHEFVSLEVFGIKSKEIKFQLSEYLGTSVADGSFYKDGKLEEFEVLRRSGVDGARYEIVQGGVLKQADLPADGAIRWMSQVINNQAYLLNK